jgi:hypothetical protein
MLGDAVGRRRSLVILSCLMALSGMALVVGDSFILLITAAFIWNLSGFVGGGGMGPLEQAVLAGSAL